MPKSHAPYPGELRRRLVELVRAGRNPEELAAEFEPSAQAIRNWVHQANRDDGRREDGLTTAEREERRRLRRENKTLREDREILKQPPRVQGVVATFSYVSERRHSAIDMLSPVAYEEQFWSRGAAA